MNNKTYSPNNLIPLLSQEQKDTLKKLVGKENLEKVDMEDLLSKRITPLNAILSAKIKYDEIVYKVIRHLNIKSNPANSLEAEEEIIKYQFQKTYNELSDEDKIKFDHEIELLAIKNGISASQLKSLGVVGTLLTANASGFGLYIMASTIVGGVSSILGVTLPFAFYTGMSSLLSVIAGPIGIGIGLAIFAFSIRHENPESLKQKFISSLKSIKSFLSSDYDFAIGIITYIGACRQMILLETIKFLDDIDNEVALLKRDNSTMETRNELINNEITKLKIEFNNNMEIISSNKNLLNNKEIDVFGLQIKRSQLE